MSRRLELEKVEELFTIWVNLHSIRGTAKQCGVAPDTVRRYVDFGDPDRGIEAFKARYARTVKQVSDLTDEAIATSYTSRAKAVIAYLEGLEKLIHQGIAALDGKQGSKPPTIDRLANAVRIAAEARRQLWEDGKEIAELTDKVPIGKLLSELQAAFSRLSEDEYKLVQEGIEEYQRTGDLPAEAEALLLGGEELKH